MSKLVWQRDKTATWADCGMFKFIIHYNDYGMDVLIQGSGIPARFVGGTGTEARCKRLAHRIVDSVVKEAGK